MKKNLFALSALAALSLLFVGSPASADTISIGLQESGVNGGAVTTETSGASTASFSGSYGTFSSLLITAGGNAALDAGTILNSTDLNGSSPTAGTINIFITTLGNTWTTGTQSIVNSFTTNLITAGWSVTEQTFYSATNALFGGTSLASVMFTAGDTTNQQTLSALLGDGPWSFTEEYTITATGAGNVNNTIDANISAVPLPGALSLFAGGLLGLTILGRRKRKALA